MDEDPHRIQNDAAGGEEVDQQKKLPHRPQPGNLRKMRTACVMRSFVHTSKCYIGSQNHFVAEAS